MIKYLILTAIMVTQTALACNPVQFIKKGATSNCDGYVFSVDKELEVRLKMIELQASGTLLQNNEKVINLKDAQIGLLNTQVDLWQKQSKALSEQLVAKENARLWYFMGGAALTTILAFAVSRSVK
jgi:hypothetical protein